MKRASSGSKRSSRIPAFGKALLVAVALVATSVGAAACGPAHHHKSTGPGGY